MELGGDTLGWIVGGLAFAAIAYTFWVASVEDWRDALFDDTGLDDYLIEDARAAPRKDTGGTGAASKDGPTRTGNVARHSDGGL